MTIFIKYNSKNSRQKSQNRYNSKQLNKKITSRIKIVRQSIKAFQKR
jgi:hypothetical protein